MYITTLYFILIELFLTKSKGVAPLNFITCSAEPVAMPTYASRRCAVYWEFASVPLRRRFLRCSAVSTGHLKNRRRTCQPPHISGEHLQRLNVINRFPQYEYNKLLYRIITVIFSILLIIKLMKKYDDF